ARGKLTISCRIRSGDMVLSCEDDGKGLDLDMIHHKAVAKGLIPAHEVLNEQDIAELIFRPGFSTMDVVTDISGRGVGMSAARAFVEGLGGSLPIELQSLQNRQAVPVRFILCLPQSKLELAA
ncbi:MAG: ATP-binding protein, partial [Pseudobdellovibrionaceae bacterium]|nr:ATP-binding protein [Pseudobdellovibrionaceae bacterium]